MEKKDQPHETLKGDLFRACYSERGTLADLPFGRDSKAGRGVGKLESGQKICFRCVLTGSCWHGEFGGRVTTSGASCVIAKGYIFGFL